LEWPAIASALVEPCPDFALDEARTYIKNANRGRLGDNTMRKMSLSNQAKTSIEIIYFNFGLSNP
jgi:hypothetical protein